jgi:hypothetical protein
MMGTAAQVCAFWAMVFACQAAWSESLPGPTVDCYTPIPGGWQIRITGEAQGTRPEPGIGVVDRGPSRYGEGHAIAGQAGENDPRVHRRPLYPPADKTLVWSEAERAKMAHCGFRPLVLAYNEPRFLFDYHAAGGLLGHLFIGLTLENGPSTWFHQWSEVDVRYVEGRMEYTLRDGAFPGVAVRLEAIAAADNVGLIVHVAVEGLSGPASLTWAYGGASAFFTNYAMTAPEFTFAPGQCSKDRIRWEDRRFSLARGFDKTDAIMEQVFAAARFLPGCQAVVAGGSSWKGSQGFGAPEAFAVSPKSLVEATEWRERARQDPAPDEKTNCVAVEEVKLRGRSCEGYIVVGMGGDIEQAIRKPAKAFTAALARNREIASRVVVHTPNPYLDAAATMMAFATDGLWGDSTVMHGGWSWRFGYLGWRGWYGPTCYGWTDRIKRAIQNFIAHGLIKDGEDAGALSSLLDTPGGVFYNMNEVFLDHVRQYFDYTNDVELMREIFPVLKGIVDWENRRLQPRNEYLYENALNTWISDSHWYIQGQCTQASAYMLQAHRFLADLAGRLGMDPGPYRERAEKIRAGMQEKLWMKREGVFAEYRDTRGKGLLHPEPELPTIYHSAEFGAADPFQIYQMLNWADTHLRTVRTPLNGKFYWSSNWFPNNGRSYTHSTYEMAYAEELNFALTNFLAGRDYEAQAILRGTLCGIFNGPTPGGLSCHAFVDGRQRANDEFADAISIWDRTVIEGLFGIRPKLPDGYIELTPQLPEDWQEASIETPLLSYRWTRTADVRRIEWRAPKDTSVHLRLPVRAGKVTGATVDGKNVEFRLEPGLYSGNTWVVIETPRAGNGRIVVACDPFFLLGQRPEATIRQGDKLTVHEREAPLTGWKDPQGILSDAGITDGKLTGVVTGEPGSGILFGLAGSLPCPTWLAVPLRIEPKTPEPPPRVWSAPSAGGQDLSRWSLVDLGSVFNSTILDAPAKVEKEATPSPSGASRVGFDYWKSHLGARHHGDSVQRPSDAVWRAKIGADGVAWTADGIPFKSVKDGPNIGIVTQTGPFPTEIEFPVKAGGRALYLMVSGTSFPVQSHMAHLRITLNYADGARDPVDLTSPLTIGDCWSTWCGRWHDTPRNGFENLGGRFGPAGSSQAGDLTKPVNVDTEAHLVPLELRPGKMLDSVRVEAVANDIVFGIMGATVLR